MVESADVGGSAIASEETDQNRGVDYFLDHNNE
jgi:hypothetical protein